MSSPEIGFRRALILRSTAFRRLLGGRFLRDARWLTASRLRAYATIMVIASLAMVLVALSGRGVNDPRGRPVGTDFLSFWTVSWALLNGREHAIYVPAALAALERTVLRRADAAFYAWQYPPIALLVVYPLALLPYLYALAIWLAAGIAGYLSVLWRILPRPLTLLAGIAFPAVILTVLQGQNAFLTVSLFGWGLLLLRRRPSAAGALFGVLAFKPQFGILIPIALVAGRHWRAIASAGLTVAGLSVATIILFGPGVWLQFLAGAPLARDILDEGLVSYYKMQSVFAAVRLLGGSLALAYSLQALVAGVVAAALALSWKRRADPDLQSAALLAATPLATPFFLDYDLMLIAPAILWLAKKGLDGDALPWERTVLAAAAIAPLVSRVLGEYTHLLVAPIVTAALFAAIIRRLYADAAP